MESARDDVESRQKGIEGSRTEAVAPFELSFYGLESQLAKTLPSA